MIASSPTAMRQFLNVAGDEGVSLAEKSVMSKLYNQALNKDGFIDVSGSAASAYGFTANPNQYFIPSTPTLPSTFDLALTDPNYKMPQVWKNNLAVDQKLPWLGLILSAEVLYNKTLNAVHYYNANLDKPVGTLLGADNRPLYAGNDNGVRVNDNVSMAAVLTNRNGAYNRSVTFKLEKPVSKGLWGYFAWA